jgi:hypothetical protein
MIQVFVRQRFGVKKVRGDKAGFAFREDNLKAAKKELGRWRATELAIAGSSSFVQAEFYDYAAFQADPLNVKPLMIIAA